MTTAEIIAAIEEEINRLEKVKQLLEAAGADKLSGALGRKAGLTTAGTKKRNLSPEARARIAAAQKRRWAKQKAGAPNTKK